MKKGLNLNQVRKLVAKVQRKVEKKEEERNKIMRLLEGGTND
jgi:hypothetical protein